VTVNSTAVSACVVPVAAGATCFVKHVVPAVSVVFTAQKIAVAPEIPTAQFVDVVIVVFTIADAPRL
jgi:hypothetical protein